MLAFSQIEFQGLIANGEGGAGWNADGTGPEPFGYGHFGIYYYGSSADLIDTAISSGCHGTGILGDFPLLAQALAGNGYTVGDITLKWGLRSLGDDIEGLDWWYMNQHDYCNFGPVNISFYLDGELMISAKGDYDMYRYGPSTGFEWYIDGAYLRLFDASNWSTSGVQSVAEALLEDVGDMEVRFITQSEFAGQPFSGSGRTGSLFNLYTTMEMGHPGMPVEGLHDDHEGFAGWDADGTGPEPFGNGHGTMAYYGASLDYDGIDPDPNAALCHFLDNSRGFYNTVLQLQYRGYGIEDVKIKLGLVSLGPDVEGEDWGYDQNNNHWCNYYYNRMIMEVGGEAVVQFMLDTNRLTSLADSWLSETTFGKAYDISGNASADAQFVAASFLRDMGDRSIRLACAEILGVSGSWFNSSGRFGHMYEITDAELFGTYEKVTYIPGGDVSGLLSADDAPFYIDGDVDIPDGETLEVHPGAKLYIRGPYAFNVQGNVMAMGTEDHQILFTRSNPNFHWDGFDYDMPAENNDSSYFDHCTFEHALAQGTSSYTNSGGAFYVYDWDKMAITNSIFQYNHAKTEAAITPSGGAIGLRMSDIFIQKCIFRYNEARDGGAMILYGNSDPVISNCLFHNNVATDDAGAIEISLNCNTPVLINNTFAHNAANMGGALQFKNGGSADIINCIIYGNQAMNGSQISIESDISQADFYYNDIEGGLEGIHHAAHVGDYLFNIDEDPEFNGILDPYPYGIPGYSPCVDAGTPDTSAWFLNAYLPVTCLCNMPRIWQDIRIDIGAYEYAITGLAEHSSERETTFSIFPNPTQGKLSIIISLDRGEEVNIEFYDLAGSRILPPTSSCLTAGKHTITRNISDLPAGMYFCRITGGMETQTFRVLKIN